MPIPAPAVVSDPDDDPIVQTAILGQADVLLLAMWPSGMRRVLEICGQHRRSHSWRCCADMQELRRSRLAKRVRAVLIAARFRFVGALMPGPGPRRAASVLNVELSQSNLSVAPSKNRHTRPAFAAFGSLSINKASARVPDNGINEGSLVPTGGAAALIYIIMDKLGIWLRSGQQGLDGMLRLGPAQESVPHVGATDSGTVISRQRLRVPAADHPDRHTMNARCLKNESRSYVNSPASTGIPMDPPPPQKPRQRHFNQYRRAPPVPARPRLDLCPALG